MLDDLRSHEAQPSEEERRWMEVDPLAAAARALVLIGLSVMIGVAASFAVAPDQEPGSVVAAAATTGGL